MNRYSQLTRLVFDFYRENPKELRALRGLASSKVSRWWGVFRINCHDSQAASDLIDAIDLLREPITQLRLAQQVKVMVHGKSIATFPVQVMSLPKNTFGERQS